MSIAQLVSFKMLPKDENFQIVIHKFALSNGQSVSF